jgi:hypothetical protein
MSAAPTFEERLAEAEAKIEALTEHARTTNETLDAVSKTLAAINETNRNLTSILRLKGVISP